MTRRFLHNTYEFHDSAYGDKCFYCSDFGDVIDHCPPISRALFYPSIPKILVKSCTECNASLAAKALPTLLSRVEFLLKKYKRKYARILKLPAWCDEEIDELSGSLKVYILSKINSKNFAIEKLAYMKALYEELLSHA